MIGSPRERGQALVEFSLVAPLLFLLLFSIIEFSRFVYYSHVLTGATHEAARYAIVHGSQALCPSGPMPGGVPNICDEPADRVKDVVSDYAVGVLRDGSYVVKVCYPGQALPPGCDPATQWVNNQRESFVKVTVDYQYRTLVPLVPLPPIGIHAETSLVINH